MKRMIYTIRKKKQNKNTKKKADTRVDKEERRDK